MESISNSIYDFLSERRFRLYRSALLVAILLGCSFGQAFFLFGKQVEMIGVPIFTALFLALYVLLLYLNAIYWVPRFLLRYKYVEYFVLLLVGCLGVLICVKIFVSHFVLDSYGVVGEGNAIGWLSMLSSLVVSTICVTSSLIPTLVRQWVIDTRNIGSLESERLKSSIEEFKSHIHSELLFAIIDHVSEEVKRTPDRASEMIHSLSELLRYELYDCQREKVVLASDIEFVRNYLSLAQHVSKSFVYSLSVKGNPNLLVRPFQFLSFIQEMLRKQPELLDIYYEIDREKVELRCETRQGYLSQVESMKLELDKC